MSPQAAPRRAILIFADSAGADLSRLALPRAALPLLATPKIRDSSADIHLFTRASRVSSDALQVHPQRGRNFAERLENAVRTLRSAGYREIVAIGSDCPQLLAEDIALAFSQLQKHRLVLGPDHRGGCYLIGLRSEDVGLLQGIRWRRNTDCAQLQARCQESDVFLLAIKHDLDSWADLRLIARAGDAAGRLGQFLIATFERARRALDHFVDLAAQAARARGQMPPPMAAAI